MHNEFKWQARKRALAKLSAVSLAHHEDYLETRPDPGSTELRSCVKVEVDVLGSPSLTVPAVSVDVKQH